MRASCDSGTRSKRTAAANDVPAPPSPPLSPTLPPLSPPLISACERFVPDAAADAAAAADDDDADDEDDASDDDAAAATTATAFVGSARASEACVDACCNKGTARLAD
jgi:hypothetical protein